MQKLSICKSSFSGQQIVGVYTVRPCFQTTGLKRLYRHWLHWQHHTWDLMNQKKSGFLLGNMTQVMWFFSGKKQVGYKEKCGNFWYSAIYTPACCCLAFLLQSSVYCPPEQSLAKHLSNFHHEVDEQKPSLALAKNSIRQRTHNGNVHVITCACFIYRIHSFFPQLSQSHVMSPRVLWP